jgi:hypothetical protein
MTRTNGWLGAALEVMKPCVWLAATLMPACSCGNSGQSFGPWRQSSRWPTSGSSPARVVRVKTIRR